MSMGAGFVFDDRTWILVDPGIRSLASLPELVSNTSRPLLRLSLALNYAAGGLNPIGYHAVNLVIHIAASLAMFGALRRIMEIIRRGRAGAHDPWFAGSVALLWMLHPLQTQSVTYAIQRGESMMGMFYLTMLYCAVRYAQADRRSKQSSLWLMACGLAGAAGMGTKEAMITAPLAIWLLEFVFFSPHLDEPSLRRWPMLAVATSPWLVAAGIIGPDTLFYGDFARPDLGTPDRMEYLLTQPQVVLHYLRLSLWPYPLCFDYGWPIARGAWQIGPGLVVVLALIIATGVALWRRSWLGFAGAWFFLTLSPTSSLVPIADVAVEHRMYLALAAPVTLLVVAARLVIARSVSDPDRRRRVSQIAVVGVALVLGGMTSMRNMDYRSPFLLWQSVANACPQSVRGRYNLGTELRRIGRDAEALPHFEAALALQPDSHTHNNLANALSTLGRVEEAIPHYRAALALDPKNSTAYYNLARGYHSTGQLADAIKNYTLYRRTLSRRVRAGNSGALKRDRQVAAYLESALAEQAQNVEASRPLSGERPAGDHSR